MLHVWRVGLQFVINLAPSPPLFRTESEISQRGSAFRYIGGHGLWQVSIGVVLGRAFPTLSTASLSAPISHFTPYFFFLFLLHLQPSHPPYRKQTPSLLLVTMAFKTLDSAASGGETNGTNVTVPKGSGGATSAVLYRHLNHEFLELDRGEGSYLVMADGQKILDASGGAAVGCIGWGNKRVAEAVMKQVLKVPYCPTIFYTTSVCEELCKLLVDSTGGHMARAYIVNSGWCQMKVVSGVAGADTRNTRIRSDGSGCKTCEAVLLREEYPRAAEGSLYLATAVLSRYHPRSVGDGWSRI